MKKAIFVIGLLVISMVSFSQGKKDSTQTPKDTLPKLEIPSGVTVFALNPDQVALLEEVISQSNASFSRTTLLIQILKSQQYTQPQPKKEEEHTAVKKEGKDKSN